MRLGDLISTLVSMEQNLDIEVVISTTTATYVEFDFELCDYEHETGDVIKGPDPGGWGGPEFDPRPLPKPVLSINVMDSEKRKVVMF